ncbi:filamentous hemagglutinin N-terminal domain-containing protein [Simkania sp.]|uniref:two-partner secretion domain-containing protein n=1 Tax=Simkania sp. TaxID=34094 RepID=UPI003B5189B7
MKLLLFLFLPTVIFALPNGLEVQNGKASATKGEHSLLVENTSNAILHWNDFSIGKGEQVHFEQPHTRSVVLNRVTSDQRSHLFGQLTSNGMVFLINPNGVLIGADASIETGGFLASTANLSPDHFLKGHYLFSDPSEEKITNQGVIHCPQGNVYFIAKTIKNSGTINGENVAFVSAQEVLITPHEEEKVSIRLLLEESEIKELSEDLQVISPYAKAIHHTGTIQALGAREENGRIYLVAQNEQNCIEGSLEATGGEVQVLGQEVYVTETAKIDVSGPRGGTLLIGRDAVENFPAQKTTVEKGAQLAANGTEQDAGKIIIWSETDTYCAASINAAAIGPEGNGGFLEISGKKTADTPLFPNLSSQNGRAGKFLIDPGSIDIIAGGDTGTGGMYGVSYIQGLLDPSQVLMSS